MVQVKVAPTKFLPFGSYSKYTTHGRPTVLVIFDLRDAFDSVGRTALSSAFHQMGTPEKSVNL